MFGTTGCVSTATFNEQNVMTVHKVEVLSGFFATGTSVRATLPSGTIFDAIITDMGDPSSAEITYTVDSLNVLISDMPTSNIENNVNTLYGDLRKVMAINVTSVTSGTHTNTHIYTHKYTHTYTHMYIYSYMHLYSGTLRTLGTVTGDMVTTNGKIQKGQLIHASGAIYTISGTAGDIACRAFAYLNPGTNVLTLSVFDDSDSAHVGLYTNALITIGLQVRTTGLTDLTQDMNVVIAARQVGQSKTEFLLSETLGSSLVCIISSPCEVTFHYTGTGGPGLYGISVENNPNGVEAGTNVIASMASAVVEAAFTGSYVYVKNTYSGTIKQGMKIYRKYATGEFSAFISSAGTDVTYESFAAQRYDLTTNYGVSTLNIASAPTLDYGIHLLLCHLHFTMS